VSGRIREHIRSNVVGYVCIFWLMTGTALAAQHLPANSVTSKSIGRGQVRTADIATGAVTGPKIRDGAITAADVRTDALTGGQIDESTLNVPGDGAGHGPAGGDLTGTYPNPSVAPNAIDGTQIFDNSLKGTDIDEASLGQVPSAATADAAANANQLDGIDSTGFVATGDQPGGDLTGTFSNLQIGGGAVGTSELATLPAARLIGDSHPTNLPANTNAGGCFTSVEFAVGGMSQYNSGCGHTGLAAPINGTYIATAELDWPGDSTGTRKLQLVSGGSPIATQQVPPAGTANTDQTISAVARLNAGDHVTIQASHTATSTLDLQYANLSLAWIGP
jgi:hypothetical protein